MSATLLLPNPAKSGETIVCLIPPSMDKEFLLSEVNRLMQEGVLVFSQEERHTGVANTFKFSSGYLVRSCKILEQSDVSACDQCCCGECTVHGWYSINVIVGMARNGVPMSTSGPADVCWLCGGIDTFGVRLKDNPFRCSTCIAMRRVPKQVATDGLNRTDASEYGFESTTTTTEVKAVINGDGTVESMDVETNQVTTEG